MKTNTSLHADHQLDELAGQFAQWRQHRSHPGERIPQPLWEQAATLARVLPYSRVAKHMRVSGRDLKQHIAALAAATSVAPNTLPSFIEVPPASSTVEIELERPDGTRLRLRCPESASPVAAVVRAFLEVAS